VLTELRTSAERALEARFPKWLQTVQQPLRVSSTFSQTTAVGSRRAGQGVPLTAAETFDCSHQDQGPGPRRLGSSTAVPYFHPGLTLI
jgi:hypothetical protein